MLIVLNHQYWIAFEALTGSLCPANNTKINTLNSNLENESLGHDSVVRAFCVTARRACNLEVLGSIPGRARLHYRSGLTKPVILSGSAHWYKFRLGLSGHAAKNSL
jgi:hypothetical protein